MHLPFICCAAASAVLALSNSHAAPAVTAQDLAGKRVLFLGDSITQDGRYVSMVEYALQKSFPKETFDIINMGLASETVSGLSENGHAGGAFPRPCLHERLDRALAKTQPKVIIACYGMNDGIYQPADPARLRAYQDGITRLLEKSRAAGARVILITPPVFEADIARFPHDKDYEQVLDGFARWIMTTPLETMTRIDLHTAMRQELQKRQQANPQFHFTNDGVHPGDAGHGIMAATILNAIGVNMPGLTDTAGLSHITADPLYQLVDQRRRQRAAAWMNHVGYTRQRKVDPNGDITKAEQQSAELQKQIDAMRQAQNR